MHIFVMQGIHTVSTFSLHSSKRHILIKTKKELLSFTWSCFETQTMPEFISLWRITQMGILLLMQTKPKVYSVLCVAKENPHHCACI